uniref:ATP synthase subunit a n=1 Tax=Paratomella rubra TaxID=90914 RepID=A0A1X9WD72_PARRR|nr:ATP synthase F0 subunit 6 [Paratomella rubra]ARS00879.1 ATP synthase F0 subunit 6 [Paratomella rubra]
MLMISFFLLFSFCLLLGGVVYKKVMSFVVDSFLKIVDFNNSLLVLWSVLTLSIMYFFMCSNFGGLLIFSSSVSMFYNLILVLGFSSWLISILKVDISIFFSHLIPLGTPMWLSPIMVFIETISIIVRPLTLSVRLFVNIAAGHLLLHLVSSGVVFIFFYSLLGGSLFNFTLMWFLCFLEIFVAVVQAGVFVLLLNSYME